MLDSIVPDFMNNLSNSTQGGEIEKGRKSSGASLIYNKGADPQKVNDLANVRSSIVNGTWVLGKKINVWGIGFSYFASETPEDPASGYDLPIRAGVQGIYDLVGHEFAHTFQVPNLNQFTPPSPSSVGSMRQLLIKTNEQRADRFLKELQTNNLIP